MTSFRSTLKTRRCMSAPRLLPKPDNYNHYFINPELRYKKKSVDPKRDRNNFIK